MDVADWGVLDLYEGRGEFLLLARGLELTVDEAGEAADEIPTCDCIGAIRGAAGVASNCNLRTAA